MEVEVTIKIPQRLYQKAERIALTKRQNVTDVLNEAILLAEAVLNEENSEESLMEREEAAYQGMHVNLMEQHAGEYVAIYQGRMNDHDRSELALLQRLNQHYPNEIVLMKQVLPLPEPDLRFRSPRFAEDI